MLSPFYLIFIFILSDFHVNSYIYVTFILFYFYFFHFLFHCYFHFIYFISYKIHFN